MFLKHTNLSSECFSSVFSLDVCAVCFSAHHLQAFHDELSIYVYVLVALCLSLKLMEMLHTIFSLTLIFFTSDYTRQKNAISYIGSQTDYRFYYLKRMYCEVSWVIDSKAYWSHLQTFKELLYTSVTEICLHILSEMTPAYFLKFIRSSGV